MNIRITLQAITAFVSNAYLKGFKTGSIYTGDTKHLCVPFLNCYSCPGAMYSCPIGALQTTIAGAGAIDTSDASGFLGKLSILSKALPLFVIGYLALIGGIVGRAACGWLCPFGWFQELLHKIPSRKFKGFDSLKYLKYVILIVFVFLLPAFLLDEFDGGEPSFCKYICPAGTLEGGLPIAIAQPSIRSQLGWLFTWKTSLLAFIILLSVFFRRPFCRWLCPLGAFYAPFNYISIYRIDFDKDSCIECGACYRKCPVNLDVPRQVDCAECLRCLECKNVCPKSLFKIVGPMISSNPKIPATVTLEQKAN